MRRVGGSLRVGLVALSAAALVGAAVTTTGSLELATSQRHTELPAVSTVALTDAQVVCPGPERIGANGLRDVGGTVHLAAASAPRATLGSIRSGAGTLALSALGQAAQGDGPSATTRRGATVTAAAKDAQAFAAQALGGLAPGVAAAQSWRRGGDDDRGLAMAACAVPAADLWLIGGGAGPSRTERLVLANPGGNSITADFTVYGAKGTIDGAGHSVSIPPRSRAVLSLDRLAPDVADPVVHVVASGGQVAGVLSDAWIDGATARGIDDATAAAPPSTDLVIAGVDKAGAASVRIANPADVEALVQVRVLGDAGPSQPDALRVIRVPAGSTTDTALDLPDGAIGLHLIADQPVVAGAWVERRVATGSDRMGDFGWAPATPAVRRLAGTVLRGLAPSGASARLLLAAGPEAARMQVTTMSGSRQSTRDVTLDADHATVVDLGGADQAWLSVSSGSVHAAVSVAAVVDKVPEFSIVPLADAPLTALSLPVRQVGS